MSEREIKKPPEAFALAVRLEFASLSRLRKNLRAALASEEERKVKVAGELIHEN